MILLKSVEEFAMVFSQLSLVTPVMFNAIVSLLY